MLVLLNALMWSLPLVGFPCALVALALGHAASLAALAAFYLAVAALARRQHPPPPLGAEPADVPHLTLVHPHGVVCSAYMALGVGDRALNRARRLVLGAPHFLVAAPTCYLGDLFCRLAAVRCSSSSRASVSHLMRDQKDLYLYPGGFVEAARIFRATTRERSVPLPNHHHEQVLAAVAVFREQLAADSVQEASSTHLIGPNERRALELLAALQNLPPNVAGILSAEDLELLRAGAEAIRTARFDPMRRRLVRLTGDHRRKPQQLPPLMVLMIFWMNGESVLQKDATMCWKHCPTFQSYSLLNPTVRSIYI
jgi:hypothetical protein